MKSQNIKTLSSNLAYFNHLIGVLDMTQRKQSVNIDLPALVQCSLNVSLFVELDLAVEVNVLFTDFH